MATLPYSRIVNVTMSRNDAFPSRRGFGTPLFLTSQEIDGVLDADHRTRVYGSIEEVAVDFGPNDESYRAALVAFSQNPRPLSFKVGFYTLAEEMTAALLQAELDAIYNQDSNWYAITIESLLRDEAYLDGLVTWVQTKNKLALIDSNDALHQNPNDNTNISARHKGIVDRTGTFYHVDDALYPAVALAAYMATRDFDAADSAYTAKFKHLIGVTNVNLPSNAITAITGFTPGIGQGLATGHMANTYIDIGGRTFVVEGSTLTPNVFLDEIHATDWIVARTEEETLGILLNNARVPFDDAGLQLIASAARRVMQQATRAGIIASDLNPANGDYEPAVEITVPRVSDVSEAQRKARIAPPISVRFRYAGAIHYTTINYNMTF